MGEQFSSKDSLNALNVVESRLLNAKTHLDKDNNKVLVEMQDAQEACNHMEEYLRENLRPPLIDMTVERITAKDPPDVIHKWIDSTLEEVEKLKTTLGSVNDSR